MSDTVIKVENISKFYQLGLINHGTLAKDLQGWWAKIRGKEDPNSSISMLSSAKNNSDKDFIYALKDVSFDVKQGEVLGIIGANGAGKSTLLKILSRVTSPTSGCIKIKGRIGSLLEVGTGFHPELTGRENIYLNGAILGMRKHEIDRKFDEIIDFSGVEKFIDTPVKRYSSGMYVRLAFAVAAHLDPEILVVDEVLAVGDADFQKKCLGKMDDVSKKEGRTVLFVSHNMATIKSLCRRAILLENGHVKYTGNTYDTVDLYLLDGIVETDSKVDISDSPKRLPKMEKLLNCVELRNSRGNSTNSFCQDDDIFLYVTYNAIGKADIAGCGYIIYSEDDVRVGGGNTYMAFPPPHKLPQSATIKFKIHSKQFTPGRYNFTVSIGSHQSILVDKIEHCISFTIEPSDIYGNGYILTKEDGVSAIRFNAEILSQGNY